MAFALVSLFLVLVDPYAPHALRLYFTVAAAVVMTVSMSELFRCVYASRAPHAVCLSPAHRINCYDVQEESDCHAYAELISL